jgi:hypothetical protein
VKCWSDVGAAQQHKEPGGEHKLHSSWRGAALSGWHMSVDCVYLYKHSACSGPHAHVCVCVCVPSQHLAGGGHLQHTWSHGRFTEDFLFVPGMLLPCRMALLRWLLSAPVESFTITFLLPCPLQCCNTHEPSFLACPCDMSCAGLCTVYPSTNGWWDSKQ